LLELRLATWLRDSQDGTGRILDPVHREPGEYADGWAALALALASQKDADSGWIPACERALRVALARSPESEFDQAALLLLAARARRGGFEQIAGIPEPAAVRLYPGGRLVSHNWVAMRALSCSLRAHLTVDAAAAARANSLWAEVCSRQLPCGLFVDSPGGEATPLTYHAKFCAMLALLLTEATADGEKRPREAEALLRGLEALAPLVSPAGVLVPYGRSRHTLFGYAAAILSFERGAELFERPELRRVADRMRARLARFQAPDGHIPCVLNDGEAARRDWDVYVNNPDYNAYAAGLLLLNAEPARCQRISLPRPVPRPGPLPPVLAHAEGDCFVAFAAQGQSVPVGTPFFCDHRYYGMQPLWIERGGEALLEPAPYRWRPDQDRKLLCDPAENPWIPFIRWADSNYCVRCYDQVELRQTRRGLELSAGGRLEAYQPVPRWRRAVGAAAGRVTRQPGAVFQVRSLPQVGLRRRLIWHTGEGRLRGETTLEGSVPSGAEKAQFEQEWQCPPHGGR
jgi:hypothetical protein